MHRHILPAAKLAAQFVSAVLLLACVEWVAAITYGVALVPVAAGLAVYRAIAGRWLPSRELPARANQ
jgi:hypothetical protein